jgi:tetratricopeptide (TPR) repeat protein
MVICVPTGSENLRNRFITYAAAGPIASLLSAGIFWILYFLLDTLVENPVGIGQFVAYLLLTISLLSAAIFIATIIPLHAGGFSTDGARVLRLARGGDIGRFELLLIRIISSSMAGTRPSELSGEDLEEATALADKLNAPCGVYLRSFQFQSAFDKGDLDRAEAELQLYLERIDSIPAGIRGSVWLDAAFFYGFARRDLSQAASYFEKFKPAAIIPKSQIYATEAVMLALQNDQEKSQQVIKKAIRELPNVLDKGMAVALHERLLTLQHRLSTNSALVEV